MMMGTDVLLEQNPLLWITKWSEESVDLMNRRQRSMQETAESFMCVVQDTLEMKPSAVPVRRLCGNLFELCNFPMETLAEKAKRGAAALDVRKLVAGVPAPLSVNGFSEALPAYGKATWANGSRASSACIGWMKTLVLEQKITADGKEAGRALKNCLEATESFAEESLACCLDQLRANCGLLKAGVMKKQGPDEPVQ